LNDFRIDSHKLLFHPERIADWLRNGDCFPIYMEISPAGACNHHCSFCALDFMGYKPRFLDAGILKERLAECASLGLRSVMFAGEGEPLLHKRMAEIAEHTRACGIEVAFTTNGVLLRPELTERLLPVCSWIKVSFNAGDPKTYARIHGTTEDDFERVLGNLARAVEIRAAQGSACTLGLQSLLLPDNVNEMERLARRCRDIGLDYLVVKPYSQHPQSHTTLYKDIDYSRAEELAQQLEALRSPGFSPIVRLRAMRKWQECVKTYSSCLALPFWSYVDAGGGVWGCSVYLDDERFRYGNIHQQGFAEIWSSEARARSLAFVGERLDVGLCRVNCRMDEVNRYLWDLKHPPAHWNFI
jgi:MoaA/NifB/PqqE/SkfB family radical SAM enzyme